jgi:hypothetical protein
MNYQIIVDSRATITGIACRTVSAHCSVWLPFFPLIFIILSRFLFSPRDSRIIWRQLFFTVTTHFIMKFQSIVSFRIGTRIVKLIYDINEQIPDVSTHANLRSLREILRISSRLKADEADADEMAIMHRAFISFFETQLTPKVN